MTKTPPIPPRRIEILAFDGTQLLDVAGPLQVFASAGAYDVAVVAANQQVRTSAGITLTAAPLPPADATLDTLIISGGSGVHELVANATILDWIRQRARHARRVASVCTGAFALGAAGLLDGKRAVTHWEDCARLAADVPKAKVEVDPIFIRDGSVWTSAGVTAGIDMSLAMVEQDLGHAASMAVARELVVFLKRSGGQAQFSAALQLQDAGGQFDKLHAWASAHLARDLSVAALAEYMAMSERTFVRQYRAATGQTPARAIELLRIEGARQMLAGQGASIKQVAARCGFGTEETMRRAFQRQLGTTPQDYRKLFGA